MEEFLNVKDASFIKFRTNSVIVRVCVSVSVSVHALKITRISPLPQTVTVHFRFYFQCVSVVAGGEVVACILLDVRENMNTCIFFSAHTHTTSQSTSIIFSFDR